MSLTPDRWKETETVLDQLLHARWIEGHVFNKKTGLFALRWTELGRSRLRTLQDRPEELQIALGLDQNSLAELHRIISHTLS